MRKKLAKAKKLLSKYDQDYQQYLVDSKRERREALLAESIQTHKDQSIQGKNQPDPENPCAQSPGLRIIHNPVVAHDRDPFGQADENTEQQRMSPCSEHSLLISRQRRPCRAPSWSTIALRRGPC